MKGFVKNISGEWAYALKRMVKPGGMIPIVELYEQYGTRNNITSVDDFVTWLMETKLPDREKWKIIFGSDDDNSTKNIKDIENKSKSDIAKEFVTPLVLKGYSVADIVGLSVRKAREVIPSIVDKNLLKYSLHELSHMPNKENVRKLVTKRLAELQTV